jgi:predicted nucleic acid-binding protein
MKRIDKVILIDADVLSHFMAAGHILILSKLYPNKKVVLKIVADEIRRFKKFQPYIDQIILLKHIEEIALPSSIEIIREFSLLRKTKGPGESACMAMARYSRDIIASNNWKDIQNYCDEHDIQYLSTMDFIYEAYRSETLTLAECDYMIYQLLSMNSPARLPCKDLKTYCKLHSKEFPVIFRSQESA